MNSAPLKRINDPVRFIVAIQRWFSIQKVYKFNIINHINLMKGKITSSTKLIQKTIDKIQHYICVYIYIIYTYIYTIYTYIYAVYVCIYDVYTHIYTANTSNKIKIR